MIDAIEGILDAADVGLTLIVPPDELNAVLADCPPGSDGYPSPELLRVLADSKFVYVNLTGVEMTASPDSGFTVDVFGRWFFKTARHADAFVRNLARCIDGTYSHIDAATPSFDGLHHEFHLEFTYYTNTEGEPRFLITTRDKTNSMRLVRSQKEYERQLALMLSERQADLADTEHSLEAVAGLVLSLVALRDEPTAAHMTQVAELSEAIADRLGLDGGARTAIKNAALMHEVGMLGVPSDLLSKLSPLSAIEELVLREHPRIGADLLTHAGFDSNLVDAVLHHHERWDGTGYPDGLAGEAIGRDARILAVADAIADMRRNRIDRPAMSAKAIAAALTRESGSGYDPRIAEAAIALLATAPKR